VRAVDEVHVGTGQRRAQEMPARVRLGVLPCHAAGGGKLVDLGRQRVVLVQQYDLAVAQQEQRAVAHAHPFDAGRPEYRADQGTAHAVERRVLVHAAADGGVGVHQRIVETGRHLARRRPVGVEKHLAGRGACKRAAGMSAHAVGQHGRQRFDMRACAG
jgi:hypothetical protein